MSQFFFLRDYKVEELTSITSILLTHPQPAGVVSTPNRASVWAKTDMQRGGFVSGPTISHVDGFRVEIFCLSLGLFMCRILSCGVSAPRGYVSEL